MGYLRRRKWIRDEMFRGKCRPSKVFGTSKVLESTTLLSVLERTRLSESGKRKPSCVFIATPKLVTNLVGQAT
jgi:hypothetical protein